MKKTFALALPCWDKKKEVDGNEEALSSEEPVLARTSGEPANSALVEIEIDIGEDTPVWELINELLEEEESNEETTTASGATTESESDSVCASLEEIDNDLLRSGLREVLNTRTSHSLEVTIQSSLSGISRVPLLRTSCTANTLQLVVKDGLKSLSVRFEITPSLNFLLQSPFSLF